MFCILYKMQLRRCCESLICVWRAGGQPLWEQALDKGPSAPWPPIWSRPCLYIHYMYTYIHLICSN